jgi:hypothetical protein
VGAQFPFLPDITEYQSFQQREALRNVSQRNRVSPRQGSRLGCYHWIPFLMIDGKHYGRLGSSRLDVIQLSKGDWSPASSDDTSLHSFRFKIHLQELDNGAYPSMVRGQSFLQVRWNHSLNDLKLFGGIYIYTGGYFLWASLILKTARCPHQCWISLLN